MLELKKYYHFLYPLGTLIITFEKDTEVDKIQLLHSFCWKGRDSLPNVYQYLSMTGRVESNSIRM